MNTESWQIENLHSSWVAEIVASGIQRGPTQVYALAPHPKIVGEVSLERLEVQVMQPVVWHSISAQTFAQFE